MIEIENFNLLNIPEKRFQVFERDTLPLIDYLKTNNFHFQEIDGRPSVSEVFNEVLKYLE